MTNVQENSTNHRLALLNGLLTTPHRELDKIYPIHKSMIDEDPTFYVKLAAWYNTKGEVRDHKEMFITNLVTHPDNNFRDVGLAMLRELAPYQVARVVSYIHGYQEKVYEEKTFKGKKVKIATGKKRKVGLNKNIPNSLKTEVSRYLKEREANDRWFDTSFLQARKGLKKLYSLLHIAPGDRAQAILFDNNPPEGSDAYLVKVLSRTTDPTEQAKIIIENKIPYRIASTIVKKMTPTVLLALIEVMTPQELINNMKSLKTHGVFNNPDLKALVESKLKLAEGSKKVSALKAVEAAKAAGLSEDLNEALNTVADRQVKAKGQITRPTVLLIDKSSSMNQAIEVGKQAASLISTIMKDDVDFYCYAFNDMPQEITSKGKTLADWNEAMKYVKANGTTGCGCSLVDLANKNRYVEQIVMITDEGENQPPAFLKAYQDYCTRMNTSPTVHIIRCGSFTNAISDKLERAGVELSKYDIRNQTDYYSLPGIVQYLTKPSKLDLLMEIMNTDLPQRKAS